jgi:phage RecT family recombinase
MSVFTTTQQQFNSFMSNYLAQDKNTFKTIEDILLGDKNKIKQFVANSKVLLLSEPKLLACNQQSLIKALIKTAQLGLPLNQDCCYLIPYGDNVQLQIGYKGLVLLSAKVGITTRSVLVFEGEELNIEEGFENSLIHKRNPDLNFDAPIRGAYAVALLPNGKKVFEYMSYSELQKIENLSQSKGKQIWNLWASEMHRKAPLKRLLKVQMYNANLDILDIQKIKKIVDYDNADFSGLDITELKEESENIIIQRSEPTAEEKGNVLTQTALDALS